MQVKHVPTKCKTLLHSFRKRFLPYNWGINPYRGCEHSCPYCFARYTHEYLEHNAEKDFENLIYVKTNSPAVLEKELEANKNKGEVVAIGTVCDPYQPAEKEFKITRQILEIFEKHKSPVMVSTKSDLILRDLDILSKMVPEKNILVNITLTSLNDEITKKIEPRAALGTRRLEVVRQLSAAGIPVNILFMPIFPYLTDSPQDLDNIIRELARAGAQDMVCGILGMHKSARKSIWSLIRNEFPELAPKYAQLYKNRDLREARSRKIYRTIWVARSKYGLTFHVSLPSNHEKEIPTLF